MTSLSPEPDDSDRRDEYFHHELTGINNSPNPSAVAITATATVGPNRASTPTTANKALLYPASFTLTYDEDGNLKSDGLWDYSWDSEDRLIEAKNTTALSDASVRRKLVFSYDHLGRRSTRKLYSWATSDYSTTPIEQRRYVYDGTLLIAELDQANALRRIYGWGLDMSQSLDGAGGIGGLWMVTFNDAAPAQNFVAHDGAGNVMALVDASTRSVSGRYEYGPFGELIRSTGPLAHANPFRFSTRYHDDNTALVYYGRRYYSPALGRWLSRDPAGEEAGLNLYALVNNNPVNFLDPFGLSSLTGDEELDLVTSSKIPTDLNIWLPGSETAPLASALYEFGDDISDPEKMEEALEQIPAVFTQLVAAGLRFGEFKWKQGLVDTALAALGTAAPKLGRAVEAEAASTRAAATEARLAANTETRLASSEAASLASRSAPSAAAKTAAQEQYFIAGGVRRSLSSLQNGVNEIPATIVRSGQADVQTTLRLDQLFSPKFEVPADSRFLNITPPIRVPIEVQPLGIPGQPASIPLNQVKIIPPGGG